MHHQVLASGGNESAVRLWDVGSVMHRSEALRADAGLLAVSGPQPLPPGAVIRDDEATISGRRPAPGEQHARAPCSGFGRGSTAR